VSDAPRPDPLAGLDPQQREAVAAPWGPVCVLAGAGTGKTRALTHRIAHGVQTGDVDPRRVLAVTFTTRAAGELRGRLRRLGVEHVAARTFHSAALRQLRYFWPSVVGGELPTVLSHKAALLAEAASRCRVRLDRSALRDLASEVEWAKVSRVAPEAYAAASATARRVMPSDLTADDVARLYRAYEDVKRGRALIDFEDVLVLTAAMLADDDAMARQVRASYAHFLVDEFQDVSPAQYRLLELWLGNRRDLTVVGDAAQTIYSFTGSTPTFLTQFTQRFPDATVVRLVRDYRSTPQIVDLANRLIAHGTRREWTLTLQSQLPGGPAPTLSSYDDEPAEAAAIAGQITKLRESGVAARDIAILYRVNAQSEVFEDALATADIPYVVRGSERFFDRAEVKQAVTLLRGAARASDADSAAAPLHDQVITVLSTLGFTATAPGAQGSARERWESWAALVALADELVARTADADLALFVQELDERLASQHAPSVDGVTLSTLHAAKGLEWDAVFLAGLCDGMVPISYAATEEQREEERRLLYVGITRARRHLAFSWAAARSPGGRSLRRCTPFLDGLLADHARRSARSTPSRRRGSARLSTCSVCGKVLGSAVERKLGHCADCEVEVDVALFERLRQWRRDEAAAASVPAYVVFTDATLTAIATSVPTDEAQLLRIPGVGRTKLERYGSAVLRLTTT